MIIDNCSIVLLTVMAHYCVLLLLYYYCCIIIVIDVYCGYEIDDLIVIVIDMLITAISIGIDIVVIVLLLIPDIVRYCCWHWLLLLMNVYWLLFDG